MATWRGSMLGALVATLGRPAWWSMALAAFLVRGGIVLVFLPLMTVPSVAGLATVFSPTITALAFGGVNATVVAAGVAVFAGAVAVLAFAGLAGAYLDRAQLREAATDEELDLGWLPVHASIRDALSLRLLAHLPTLAAGSYATIRLIGAAYQELTNPGDGAVPIVLRVAQRTPEALLLLAAVWLAGETVGALAARRAAAGASFTSALGQSVQQLLGLRGLATLAVSTVAVWATVAAFLLVVGQAWSQVRLLVLDSSDPILIGGALLVLVAAWLLGLAIVGAALAWRTAAWTAEVAPARAPALDSSIVPVRESARESTRTVASGASGETRPEPPVEAWGPR